MTESDIHRVIKRGLGRILREEGYEVDVEARDGNKMFDLLAKKGDETLTVEVFRTHLPDWVVKIGTGLQPKKAGQKRPDDTKVARVNTLTFEVAEAARKICFAQTDDPMVAAVASTRAAWLTYLVKKGLRTVQRGDLEVR